MDKKRTCETCAWRDMSTCRYNAPAVTDKSVFPFIDNNYWCRHHSFTRGWSETQQMIAAPHADFAAKTADQGHLLELIEEKWEDYEKLISDWYFLTQK